MGRFTVFIPDVFRDEFGFSEYGAARQRPAVDVLVAE